MPNSHPRPPGVNFTVCVEISNRLLIGRHSRETRTQLPGVRVRVRACPGSGWEAIRTRRKRAQDHAHKHVAYETHFFKKERCACVLQRVPRCTLRRRAAHVLTARVSFLFSWFRAREPFVLIPALTMAGHPHGSTQQHDHEHAWKHVVYVA